MKARDAGKALSVSDPHRAIEEFTDAIEKAPEHERPELLEERAAILDRISRTEEARRDREEILSLLEGLDPQVARSLPSKANAHRVESLERRARTYQTLGRTEEARRDWQAVVEFLDAALATTPNEGEPLDDDWMVHATGGMSVFVSQAEKVRSSQSRNQLWANSAANYAALGHPDLLMRRGDVRRGLGDDPGARKDYDSALALLELGIVECTDPRFARTKSASEVAAGVAGAADILRLYLKTRAELFEHSGDETAAVRDRLAAAAVLESSQEAEYAAVRSTPTSWRTSDDSLASLAGAQMYARGNVNRAHQAAGEERRQLIDAGRAVELGTCGTCGVVQVTHDARDAAGHQVEVVYAVARGDVDGVRRQLQGEGAERTARADWYQDPAHRHEYRYWDGTRWTEQVADHGVQAVDPIVATPV